MGLPFGMELVSRERGRISGSIGEPFGVASARGARAFHATLPGYAPTPLVSLPGLAASGGVASVHVKDESRRFDLNAFKVLGGSYAIARVVADRLGLAEDELAYEALTSEGARRALTGLTFVTATDGNHGRGVAWTARRLGANCVVYLPRGSAAERLENIRSLGADASITDMNYDDTVRMAADRAEQNGWVLVQDTSWEGYERIPMWIMRGYTTLVDEAIEQLDGVAPTHAVLQAGVGAMAGAVSGYLAARFGEACPRVIVVEPTHADCVFRTARANDGALHAAPGDLDTMMAGLACGEPCGVAWRVLDAVATDFVSMPDEVAAVGMRALAHPAPGDRPIVSGESGAAGFGLVAVALSDEGAALREALGFDERSRILCISTEGATDQRNYRRIVGSDQ